MRMSPTSSSCLAAEDLVPVLDAGRDATSRRHNRRGTTPIQRYRPRIEGLFARIERWTRQNDGDVHWRSISRDNILTLYGKDADSRIADPEDPERIFTWLICETRDDKGNAVLYDYKREDGSGVDVTRACERNRGDRDDRRRTANRYLKRYPLRQPGIATEQRGTTAAVSDRSASRSDPERRLDVRGGLRLRRARRRLANSRMTSASGRIATTRSLLTAPASRCAPHAFASGC